MLDFAVDIVSKIRGSICIEFFKPIISRALADPTSIFVNNRSKSWMPLNSSRSFARIEKSLTNSSTESSRLLISTTSNNGFANHRRSNRLPMAVRVKSSTENSVPDFEPSRKF